MKAIVSIKDVINEMDVLSEEYSPFLNRNTGELVTLSSEELYAAEEDDNIDDYQEWQQDMIIKAKEVISSDDYLPLPSKFDIHEYHIMEDFCCSLVDDEIKSGFLIKSEVEELSDGLKIPSRYMELKRNGIVFDRRHLRRSLLIGSKQTKSLMRKMRLKRFNKI